MYHHDCNTRFRLRKEKPGDRQTQTVPLKRGRPIDEDRETAFEEIIDHLIKNDDEQVTISELNAMMMEKVPDHSSAFSGKWLQNRLMERLKDQVILTTVNGKSNVITFV